VKTITETADLQEASWQYNGFDCCLTYELHETLSEEFIAAPKNVRETYEQSLALVAPTMEMSLRGIRVHSKRLIDARGVAQRNLRQLIAQFDRLCNEVFGIVVNAGSWQQVTNLLYREMGLRGAGTQRGQLERLAARNWQAKPWISHILAIRDMKKQIGFLNARLTANHRMTYSLNVAGTETGRFSCRDSVFRIGTNCQNIDKRHRGMFIADPGKLLVEIDLEQADSRNVGATCFHVFGEATYLNACESGDLHSAVVQLLWGDVDPHARYKGVKSYRDFAKGCGHGTNYMGTPQGISYATGIPAALVKDFQAAYFERFPEIRRWHEWTRQTLKREHCLTTLFGRRRVFHDRTWDTSTVRDAVAFLGQSMTADETNLGMLALWQQCPWIELLLQVHDSVLFQIPEDAIDRIPELLEAMQVTIEIRGRPFTVPLSCSVGKSWLSEKAGGDMREWGG